MTQENFWSLLQQVLEHDKDEDHYPVEVASEGRLTTALLALAPEEIAAFEQMFQDYSLLAHKRITEVRQEGVGENYYRKADLDANSLIGWTMIHGQEAFLGCLADPATAVDDFAYEVEELFHHGADLIGLAPRAYLLKTGQPMPGCESQADDGAERGVLAPEDVQRLGDLLPSLRAVTAGAENLRGEVKAALEELEAARRGLRDGGAGVSGYFLYDDIAATRGLLSLLSGVTLLMPRSLLQWCDST